MKLLGKISGTGLLHIHGAPLGAVDYDISIMFDGALKSADGRLHGEDMLLQRAFDARGDVTLEVEGGLVTLTVTRLDQHGALIRISGPVPRF